MAIKTHKWSDMRRKLSPEREAEIARDKAVMRAEMRLYDLRKARGLTQQTLAEAMDVAQGEVSKIERRTDVYLATLRRFIEAMGGELVLVARFSDGDIPLTMADDEPEEEPEEEHDKTRQRRRVEMSRAAARGR